MSNRRSSEAAAKEKAERMKQYLEEKYERMRRKNEDIKKRKESLEDHMVSLLA